MTNQQFDYLLSLVKKQNALVNTLVEKVDSLVTTIAALNEKTVVVNDVDDQIEQLKIDIKSLIDEQEA